MEDININKDIEFEYATKLFNQKILPGPGYCDCGYTNFSIKIYKNFKTSGVLYLDALIINEGKDIQLESIHFFLYFQG